MLVRGYKVRSTPATAVWAGVLVVLALLSLGLVHLESGRSARAKIASRPLRPLLLVDLVANREARGGKPLPELEAWRAAAAAIGREVEVFEGERLIDVDPARYAVWVLPAQDRLSDYDWEALDSYPRPRRRGGADGRARGLLSEDEREPSVLERLFPGRALHRRDRRGQEPARGRPQSRWWPASRRATSSPSPSTRARSEPRRSGRARLARRARRARPSCPVDTAAHRSPGSASRSRSSRTRTTPRASRRNALRFAAREPLLDLRPWPDGRPCAVLVDGGREHDSADELCRADTANPGESAIDALVRGGCHFATTTSGERVLPEVLERPSGTLVAIPEPRPRRDAQGAGAAARAADRLRARRAHGLDLLAAHRGELARRGRARGAVRERRPRARRAAAPGSRGPDELADWWLARAQVEARLEPLAPDTVRVVVHQSRLDGRPAA